MVEPLTSPEIGPKLPAIKAPASSSVRPLGYGKHPSCRAASVRLPYGGQLSMTEQLPIRGTSISLDVGPGTSTMLVGANGSGKSRLAVELEGSLGERAHRISAQRALALDPSIEKVSEENARNLLRFGYENPEGYGGGPAARKIVRWGNDNPRFVFNDASALMQLLFAEQANIAVSAYNSSATSEAPQPVDSYLRRLKVIYERILPTRQLTITADQVQVSRSDIGNLSSSYSITQMSDGEKAVFYIVGQVLAAPPEAVFIMDEPEIHVHRSILGRLWDELEAARPDCAFIVITHDLEFAGSRAGHKYLIRQYLPDSGWDVEEIPEAAGFSDETVALILGSRSPVLFVEGRNASLDLAFYRACYPGFTVIARGSCEEVIHSVVTMRSNSSLTRVDCFGLVDADSRSQEDQQSLADMGIQSLPVAEIENILLLPSVSRRILEIEGYPPEAIETKLQDLSDEIFSQAADEANANRVALDFCRRRIDRALKIVDLSDATVVADLQRTFDERTRDLNIHSLADSARREITDSITSRDLPRLLAIYDRKGPLLALASSRLRNARVDVFSAWVTRMLTSPNDSRLRDAISQALPTIPPTDPD
ncbi:AAA family ATPase [Phycicoccus jejuensis]|uniref:AAA family ATPase n=1 Tax=Phycicoccus jejuensis TaxID=367299 RepID=UPI00384E482B